jgi:Sodium:alanine symporter family
VLDLAKTVNEGVQFIWVIADITTGLMMLPNLLAMWLLGGKIKELTTDYLRHTRTGNPLKHAAFHFAAPRTAEAHTQPTPKPITKAKDKPKGKSRR